MANPPRDFSGQKIGKMIATKPTGERDAGGSILWFLDCGACGAKNIVLPARRLSPGSNQAFSCGCAERPNPGRFKKNGVSKATWEKTKEIVVDGKKMLRASEAERYLGIALSTLFAWGNDGCPYLENNGRLPFEIREPSGQPIRYYDRAILDTIIKRRQSFPSGIPADCYSAEDAAEKTGVKVKTLLHHYKSYGLIAVDCELRREVKRAREDRTEIFRRTITKKAFRKAEVDAFVDQYALPADKMSISQAAKRLNVSIRTIHNWCNDKCPLIDRKIWSAPAIFLGAGAHGAIGKGVLVNRADIEGIWTLLDGMKRGKDGRPILGPGVQVKQMPHGRLIGGVKKPTLAPPVGVPHNPPPEKGKTPKAASQAGLPKVDQAIVIIIKEPGLSTREVARRVGCSASTLSENKGFQRAQSQARNQNAGYVPKGYKTKEGNIEAQDYRQDDDEK